MITNYNEFNKTGSAPAGIQGQPIKAQIVSASVYGHSSGYPDIDVKGEHQPKRFNDIFWGILFYAHMIAMAYLAITYLPQMDLNNSYSSSNNNDKNNNYYNNGNKDDDDDYYNYADDRNDYHDDDGYWNDEYYNRRILSEGKSGSIANLIVGVLTRSLDKVMNVRSNRALEDYYDANGETNVGGVFLLVGLTVLCSFVLSILCLSVMIRFAEGLIKMSLFFNMIIGIAVAIVGFSTDKIEAGVFGIILFAMAACYAWAVWSRIPFAAMNLVTASTAIKSNLGLTFFAYAAIFINGLWLLFWSASAFSTIFVKCGYDAETEACQDEVNPVYYFFFILSLYWTIQIIKNVVHVTVAGTVGTWWWTPLEASGCCSKGVRDSHNRALTYSFGSICFGSLLVAIVQTLKQFAESAREADDGLLRCLADCILGCLETIMEMFNEWAFVYVGLYGYSFIDAAKNVFTLLKSRGWTVIITDYIVDRVLMMLSFGNGLLNGACAAYISYAFNLNLEAEAFTVGFFIGILLTSTVLGLVSSGVNTVIVCYAEDPAIFEVNHYELSLRMRDTWRVAFPDQFAY